MNWYTVSEPSGFHADYPMMEAHPRARCAMKHPILIITVIALVLGTSGCSRYDDTFMKPFADKLRDKHICSESSYKQLIADIDDNKLTFGLSFLKYCNRALVIELKDHSNDPAVYLEQIHRKTAALLPHLSFTDFEFQIVVDSAISDDSSKSYNAIVSLRSNGKTFRHKSFINYKDIGNYPGMEYFGKIDQQEYYKIFNKILADVGSPYRLHEVKSMNGNAVDWNRFGIIALTKERAEMLHGGGVGFIASYESFKTTLTTKKIDSAIAEYQRLGLLAHLSSEQIAAGVKTAAQQENQTLNDVLRCFPDVICFFDTELSNIENPYAELLLKLTGISKGVFKPTDIVDHFAQPSGDTALVQFSLGRKTYSKALLVQSDWIDVSFFDLVQQATSDHQLKGEFYQLYTGGQEASVIFLTPEQHHSLRLNKMIVFADENLTEDL